MARRQRRKVGGGRYQQQVDTADDNSGVSRPQALVFSRSTNPVEWYKMDAGDHEFNIIPYVIKSKLHPEVYKTRKLADDDPDKLCVGDLDFVMDVFIHQYIGAQEADILCPKKNYGKPCPICDEVDRLYEEKQNDAAKNLQASRRCFYNLQESTNRGMAETTKVIHVSHYLFTKELMEQAKACTKGNGIVPFAELDDGTLVSFRAAEDKLGKNKILKFKSFNFPERQEEIPEGLEEKAVSFDECLVLLSSEEIEALLWSTGDDDDDLGQEPAPRRQRQEEEPRQSRPQRRQRPEEDAPGESRGQTMTSRSDDDLNSEGAQDAELVEDKPARRRSRPPEDQAEDEGNKCPKGHCFGKDCDEHGNCSTCPDGLYFECQKLSGK